MPSVRTGVLEISYDEGGTADGPPILLLHGWPDDPRGWRKVAETWSPSGWFDDTEFATTAKSFDNPDWTSVTLNAYRRRWRPEASDSRYDPLESRLVETETISTPTLMIQGGMDHCDEPSSSEGLDAYFTGGYRRMVLRDVGHFPPREAPNAVADAVIEHLLDD
jgi:pimeloyl-ACP methyl ester carboxylesterase